MSTSYTPTIPLKRAVDTNVQSLDPSLEGTPTTYKIVATDNWCGRSVNNSIKGVVNGVGSIFNGVVKAAAIAAEDTTTLTFISRKLDKHIIAMLQEFDRVSCEHFSRFSTSLKSVIGVMNFAKIVVNINYFVQGKFKKDSLVTLCGKISMALSDLGFALIWLKNMGLVNLSKISCAVSDARVFSFVPTLVSCIPPLRHVPHLERCAQSIGSVRVFSFIDKVSLQAFAESTLSIAYMYFAAKACQNFIQAVKADNTAGITSAVLEGFYLASELAIDGLLLTGYTNVMGLGMMAATSVAFAVTSLAYKTIYTKQIQQTAEL